MKLIKNISWILGANLIVSFSKWLLLVIIAKVLTPEDVGAYSLAFAIGAPITLFANMKLRSLYLTERNFNFSDYIHTRNILSALAFIFLVGIALIIYPEYSFVILLVGLNKIFDLQSDMYYAIPHKEEDMDYIGKLMICKYSLILICFSLILIIFNNLILSLLIQLLIQVLFLFLVEKKSIYRKYHVTNNRIEFGSIKNVMLIGIPLGLVQLIVSLNTSYPRYLLEFFESPKVLGYFSAISYILVVGNMMMNAVSQTFIPFLAKLIKEKEIEKFRINVFLKLNLISLTLGICSIVFSIYFGEFFLRIVYGTEYANYSDILILMSIAMLFAFFGWTFDIALLALRYISIQPKISIVTLLCNTIIGFILIKNYGIYGATYTLIITNVLQIVLRAFFVNKYLKNMKSI